MDSFSSLKGRILLNRFCPSIRAFHCNERDFYISLKEIERNPRMQRMMYEIEEERFLLLLCPFSLKMTKY